MIPGAGRISDGNRVRAFALLLVIVLVALLAGLVMGLLALCTMDRQRGGSGAAAQSARSAALAALEIALAQLNWHAGADECVTTTARETDLHPLWTGVWVPEAEMASAWLVSGNEADPLRYQPSTLLQDSEMAWLVSRKAGGGPSYGVQAPWARVDGSAIRYAYWVSDEGVKLSLGVAAEGTAAMDEELGPHLEQIFSDAIADFGSRRKLLLIGQASTAGFERATLAAFWPWLTTNARRAHAEEPLPPFCFNINSRAPIAIWRAALSAAIAPAGSGGSDATDRLFAELEDLLAARQRPFGTVDAFVQELKSRVATAGETGGFDVPSPQLLSHRSDTFIVRAKGEDTTSSSGTRVACLEALVQRAAATTGGTRSGAGRFTIRWLRWLDPSGL